MADAAARVLFIEDDAGLAAVVTRHLRARGHDARIAGSAEEAVAMIAAGYRPTVVLLDINLPGASGWDLLRTGGLRAAGSPPVYIVSATSIPSARLHEFDVAGFLPKPFAVPTLIEIVERHHGDADGSESPAGTGGLDAF